MSIIPVRELRRDQITVVPILKDPKLSTQVNNRGIGAMPEDCGGDSDVMKSVFQKVILSPEKGLCLVSQNFLR